MPHGEHKHTPAGEMEGRISLLVLQTDKKEREIETEEESEGEQAATSTHISQTIKLELAFDTSLTNCLLNKRLELQHN